MLNPGPCQPWITPSDVEDCTVTSDVCLAASEILWALSGRQFGGLCDAAVRPAPRALRAGRWVTPPGWDPSWGWTTPGYGWCADLHHPGVGVWRRLRLGPTPIVDVSAVTVDGALLDDDRWTVVDRVWLLRLADPDGTNPGWPTTQDLTLPATEPGTWQVSYTWGVDPPAAGVEAAKALACALTSGDDCQLDPRVTALTRQGVTLQLPAVEALTTAGTGIPAVDAFLAAFNPHRLTRPARLLSPDTPARPWTLRDSGS